MSNFTDELDEGFVQQMLDVFVEVVAVGTVDLGRDFELATRSPGNLNRAVQSFFRRNPPEKEQIVFGFFLEVERIGGEGLGDGPATLCVRQWAPLRMRNGDYRHIGKLVVDRRQIGQVEPAMQGGQMRKR